MKHVFTKALSSLTILAIVVSFQNCSKVQPGIAIDDQVLANGAISTDPSGVPSINTDVIPVGTSIPVDIGQAPVPGATVPTSNNQEPAEEESQNQEEVSSPVVSSPATSSPVVSAPVQEPSSSQQEEPAPAPSAPVVSAPVVVPDSGSTSQEEEKKHDDVAKNHDKKDDKKDDVEAPASHSEAEHHEDKHHDSESQEVAHEDHSSEMPASEVTPAEDEDAAVCASRKGKHHFVELSSSNRSYDGSKDSAHGKGKTYIFSKDGVVDEIINTKGKTIICGCKVKKIAHNSGALIMINSYSDKLDGKNGNVQLVNSTINSVCNMKGVIKK